MSQYVHLLTSSGISLPTDLWVPVMKSIRPMRSSQLSGGVYYNLLKTYDLSLEGYYKRLRDVIAYRDGMSLLSASVGWQDRVAIGCGESYGMELLCQRTSGRLTGWLGYGLSWSDRWFLRGEINGGRRTGRSMAIAAS
jgi:hypothetical protein